MKFSLTLLARATGALALAFSAAPDARAGCTVHRAVQLPAAIVDGHVTVSVIVNGAPARMFIDTGAPFSMIFAAAAARFGAPITQTDIPQRIEGLGKGVSLAQIATAKTFGFAGVGLHNAEFYLSPAGFGAGVDGVIGQNLLRGVDLEFDLGDGMVRLLQPEDCGATPLAYWAADPNRVVSVPFDGGDRPEAHRVDLAASLSGLRIKARLDTGSPRSMLMLATARRLGVDPSKAVAEGRGHGVERDSDFAVWRAKFDDFALGGEAVKHVSLLVADTDVEDVDLLLGVDFLKSHRVLVSNSQHRLYFTYQGGPVFQPDDRPAERSGK